MLARLRRHPLIVPALVLLLGASAAWLTWVTTSRNEAFQRHEAFDAVAGRNARRVEFAVDAHVEFLRHVRALLALRGEVGDAEFARLVGGIMPARDGVPRSTMMFVRADPQVARVETVVPAAAGARWEGLDLRGVPRADLVLEAALAGPDVAASEPLTLPDAAGGHDDLVTLFVLPVFDVRPVPVDVEARRAVLSGYLVDVVSGEALLDEVFAAEAGYDDVRDNAITVTDLSSGMGEPFASFGAAPSDGTERAYDTLEVGDRKWKVETIRLTLDRLTVHEFLQRPSTTLSACIFLVVTLCAHIVYALNRQKSLVQEEVAARTAELRQKNLLLQRQEQELAEINLKLLEQSHTDPLTEILNRRGFEEQLEKERQRTGRTGVPYGLLIFDVDNFKGFNDHYGHIAGDDVLKRVAHIIYGEARRIDCVARYGGEEFVILASGTDAVGLLALGERVRERIQEAAIPNAASPLGVVTVSGGGALSKVDAEHDPKPVLEIADRCLYEAKATGKNRVVMRM